MRISDWSSDVCSSDLSRSHSLPRRCRWRSTRQRTGATMADERRILLVEDDVLIGMMLVDMLDTLGYPEPAQAAAIDEALAIVDVVPVAAALIDINLGETQGWPVAAASDARGHPSIPNERRGGNEGCRR